MAINKIFLGGYVSDDPKCYEIKEGENAGKFLASFNLAEKVGEKDGVNIYKWHEVTAYDKLVEPVMENIKKGMRIMVEGRASTHAYINNHNKLISHLKIRLSNYDFLNSSENNLPATEVVGTPENNPEEISDN